MLKALKVRNLGPIESADLDGTIPVNLLLGPNESGKTTLVEALKVLYTGTRGDVEVKGNAALTRAGAKGWKVEATFDDDTVFTATRSQRPLREDLQKKLGDPRVFAALCDTSGFLGMKPAERKQLLADLAASDTLALADELEAEGVEKSIVAAVRAGNMRRAHTLATDLRRGVDRKLNAIKELAERQVEDTEVETKRGTLRISQVPLDTIETGISRLSERRDAIRKAEFDVERWERAKRDADAAQEELDDLQAEAGFSAGDRSRLQKLLDEAGQLRRDNAQAHVEIRAASELDQELAALVKEGEREEEKVCPTCRSPLTRGSPAWDAIIEHRRECANTISTKQEVTKVNAAKLKEMDDEIGELGKRKGASEQAAAFRKRLEQKVAEAQEAGEQPDVPTGDVEKLTAEVARLQGMRDVRRTFDTRIDDQNRAVERMEAMEPERDLLAALEKRLDPSAIADEAALLTDFNGHLARTCGKLGVPVVINDGYDLSIHGRAPGLASDSARLRAGFGVSVALSVLSGVGLAFLDRFEALDDANRKRVLGLLKGLTDDGLLSWVLIAAVKQNPKRGADVPWLAWISVADGTATYLGGA